MNIFGINQLNKIQYKYDSKKNIKTNSISADIFIKNSDSNTRTSITASENPVPPLISFCGIKKENKDSQSVEEFKKWAEKTDFFSKVIDIAERTGKILGSGFEGTTYEIPDCDKWVLKEYKRNNFIRMQKDAPDLIELDDISPDLNIGQAVARIDIPTNNKQFCYSYYILKKQTGESYGVSNNDKDFPDENTRKIHLRGLRKAADLPQSAFDKCVKDVQYITNQGYLIDYANPHNLLIDTDKEEIHFVDINDRISTESNQQAEVLFSLLDAEFGKDFITSNEESEEKAEAAKLTKLIVDKYFTAMRNNNIRFSSDLIFSLLDSHLLDGNTAGSSTEEKIKDLQKKNLI